MNNFQALAVFLNSLNDRIIVSINWKRYHSCTYPLHIWIVVDYTTVFVFRVLMFVDNGLAAGMGLDLGRQQRFVRFCGRIVVISILVLVLYPFLWAWTVIGSIWFTSARSCLPEEGQKWGFLIWLLFSYCGLICIACMSTGKVRGLPCAHNFHVECIDEWLRLNIKCPRCRCSVFPNLDLSALANTQRNQTGDSSRSSQASASSFTSMPSGRYIRAQPVGQSNLLRLQDLLRTIRVENSVHSEMSIGERGAGNTGEGSVAANIESNQMETSRRLENEIREDQYHAGMRNGLTAGIPNNMDAALRNNSHRQCPYNITETVSVVVDRSPPARF